MPEKYLIQRASPGKPDEAFFFAESSGDVSFPGGSFNFFGKEIRENPFFLKKVMKNRITVI